MLSRASGKLLRKHTRNPRRVQTHIHGLLLFALRAFFAVGKCVVRVSTCVREETGNQRCVTLGLLCVSKNHHATKNCCVLTPQAHGSVSMRTETDMFLRKDCCDLAPPDRLTHTIMLRFGHGGTVGSQSARKKTWISIHDQGNRFMRQKFAAFSRCWHTWILPCAQ